MHIEQAKECEVSSLELNKLITNIDTMPCFSPPGHWGTQNVLLVGGDDTGTYEMRLSYMAAQGGAEGHVHDENYQVFFILEGVAMIELGTSPVQKCPAGSVIRIPPGIYHRIPAGEQPLRFIVAFNPPLE
jgi:quercetin dioxygenase-like cupin family protein